MILFNITFSVDTCLRDEFLKYLRESYIPAALACGMCSPVLSRPRFEPQPNMLTGHDSESYALQMTAPGDDSLEELGDAALPALYNKVNHWGAAVTLFPTVLDVMEI